MASKAADDTSLVPHAVIAQAEAAVLGNIEDNSPLNRQPTHVDTSHPSLSGPQAPLSNDADSATAAPPAYGEHHGELDIRHDGFDTQAKVTGTETSFQGISELVLIYYQMMDELTSTSIKEVEDFRICWFLH